MSSEDVMQMHTEFPIWVSEFELGEEPNTLKKNWAGLAAVTNDADTDEVEELVRLAFKTRQKASNSFVQKFRTAFHDVNPEYMMSKNDREIEVLAGCGLVVLLGSDDAELAALVALSITTASTGGNRKHNLPMDIVGLAESALLKLSESNSKRPDLTEYASSTLPKLDLKSAIAKAEAEFSAVGIAEAFSLAATAISATLKTIVKKQCASIDAVNTFIQQQDEELQMLWWLTGGRSIDEDCAFKKVDLKMQPLLFAKELADQTEVMPGPGSIKALLSRAGLKDVGKVTLQESVNAAKTEWLSDLVDDIEPSSVTRPIHFAIKRQLETGAGEAWAPGWAATTELDANLSFSPLVLGSLFYRERLLVLFSGE